MRYHAFSLRRYQSPLALVLDVIKFEQRVTEALEIQEDVENMEQREIIEGRQKSSQRRRYMMVGLATLGTYLCLSFDNSYSHLTFWFRLVPENFKPWTSYISVIRLSQLVTHKPCPPVEI